MVGVLATMSATNPLSRVDEFIAAPAVHYHVKASFGPVRRAGPVRPLIRALPGRNRLWPTDFRPRRLHAFRAELSVHSARPATCGASSLPVTRTWAGAAAAADCWRQQGA